MTSDGSVSGVLMVGHTVHAVCPGKKSGDFVATWHS